MTNYYESFINNPLTKLFDPKLLLLAFQQPVKGKFGRLRFHKIEYDAVSFIISRIMNMEDYILDIDSGKEIYELKVMENFDRCLIDYFFLIQQIHEIADPDDRKKVITYLQNKDINNV